MKTVPINKKPLKRSIIIGCSFFFVSLCLILSILTYRTYTASLSQSYEARMTDIVEYVEYHIDVDDLAECVATGNESEKYREMAAFMDDIMETFDIHYLYIATPISSDPPVMQNIFSADTAQGRLEEPDGLYLNALMYEDYGTADMLLYMDAYKNDGITFFKNFSIWGHDYTALKPLKDKDGNRFCALCVDIEVAELDNAIKTYTVVNIILIAVLGLIFIALFLI